MPVASGWATDIHRTAVCASPFDDALYNREGCFVVELSLRRFKEVGPVECKLRAGGYRVSTGGVQALGSRSATLLRSTDPPPGCDAPQCCILFCAGLLGQERSRAFGACFGGSLSSAFGLWSITWDVFLSISTITCDAEGPHRGQPRPPPRTTARTAGLTSLSHSTSFLFGGRQRITTFTHSPAAAFSARRENLRSQKTRATEFTVPIVAFPNHEYYCDEYRAVYLRGSTHSAALRPS